MYWPLGIPSSYSLPPTSFHQSPNAPSSRSEGPGPENNQPLVSIAITSLGTLLATATTHEIFIWQSKPLAVVASLCRSSSSLNAHGETVKVDLFFDSERSPQLMISTNKDYLIFYTIVVSHSSTSRYKLEVLKSGSPQRRRSIGSPMDVDYFLPCYFKYRRAIKVDSGLSCVIEIPIDNTLVIATKRPPAIQSVIWEDQSNRSHTQLLSKIPWLKTKSAIAHMSFDRPTNLFVWVSQDGKAYVVRKPEFGEPWTGWLFHDKPQHPAQSVSINARFSIISVACGSGLIEFYVAKDYSGNIPFSHRIAVGNSKEPESNQTPIIKKIAFSPDGYVLFVGTNIGWQLSSVYGHLICAGPETVQSALSGLTAASVTPATDSSIPSTEDCAWAASGLNIFAFGRNQRCFQAIPLAKSSVTNFYTLDGMLAPLLQIEGGFMVYRGLVQRASDVINPESKAFSRFPLLPDYEQEESPLRCISVSPDGRYVSVAGKVGFAHLSTISGRWRVMDTMEPASPESIYQRDAALQVKGGMCWYGNLLFLSTDLGESHEIRIYHRYSTSMASNSFLYREVLSSPILTMSIVGDCLLVFCQDNTLSQFLIIPQNEIGIHPDSPRLVQLGQINFRGIIHSPTRVRAISWILPPEHSGIIDPAEDAAIATVVFLLDGKLVLLRPTTRKESQLPDLKYDLKVLSDKVEWFTTYTEGNKQLISPTLVGSIWAWDGKHLNIWLNPNDPRGFSDAPILLEVEFYPLTILPTYGVVAGLSSQMVRPKSTESGSFRLQPSVQLFVHRMLHRLLEIGDGDKALRFASEFNQLEYFTHILELLLHDILEHEADISVPQNDALLPQAIKLLDEFPRDKLDAVVGCTRKTEVRLWQYLFKYAGRPKDLFEQCMERGMLKSAGGYLLVLHTLEHLRDSSEASNCYV